jgi:hypothetical protein
MKLFPPLPSGANRSLQQLIYQYLTENETRRYIDALPELVETYNSRPHRALQQMTPNEADLPQNEGRVSSIQRERFAKLLQASRTARFNIGDTVRVQANFGNRFARGYNERFTRELFEIVAINKRMPVPMYELRSLMTDHPVAGNFYASGWWESSSRHSSSSSSSSIMSLLSTCRTAEGQQSGGRI